MSKHRGPRVSPGEVVGATYDVFSQKDTQRLRRVRVVGVEQNGYAIRVEIIERFASADRQNFTPVVGTRVLRSRYWALVTPPPAASPVPSAMPDPPTPESPGKGAGLVDPIIEDVRIGDVWLVRSSRPDRADSDSVLVEVTSVTPYEVGINLVERNAKSTVRLSPTIGRSSWRAKRYHLEDRRPDAPPPPPRATDRHSGLPLPVGGLGTHPDIVAAAASIPALPPASTCTHDRAMAQAHSAIVEATEMVAQLRRFAGEALRTAGLIDAKLVAARLALS